MITRGRRRLWAAFAAGLWLAGAATAPARAEAAPAAAAEVDYAALDAREAEDQKVVDRALAAMGRRGARALADFEDDLAAVMARAPETYPQVEVRPNLVIVRSEDPGESLGLLMMVAAASAKEPAMAGKSAVSRRNTYITAAFLLGFRAVDRRAPQEALEWLDRGLALQPNEPRLTAEKAAALTLLRRWADTPAMCDAALDANPFMGKTTRALLLRNKGFALIELGRLDEAEAAYVESRTYEPDSPVAAQELDYIRRLRAGGPPAPPALLPSPDAAPAPAEPPPADRRDT
ncbi:MAG: hypothetical protein ACOY4K_06045 [Pseudomonadota bacterium]